MLESELALATVLDKIDTLLRRPLAFHEGAAFGDAEDADARCEIQLRVGLRLFLTEKFTAEGCG